MKKSLLMSFLSIAMVFAIIVSMAGCGQQVTTSEVWEEYTEVIPGTGDTVIEGEEGKNVTTGGDEASGSANADKPSANSEFDLKGQNVTLAIWGESKLEPQPADPLYAKETALIKQIEEKYNCKLKFKNVPDWSAYSTAFKTAMASGSKYADALLTDTTWIFPTLLMKDYIAPIDGYVNFNDPALDKSAMEAVSYKGKHYLICSASEPGVPTGTYYNKTVFEKFGAKTPAEYVKEGNWNWKTFLEAAKATNKTSGGVRYYGFALKNGNIETFMNTNGGNAIQVASSGKRTYAPDSKWFAGLQFAWDLYNTHGVTPPNCGDAVNVWNKGNAAMIFGAQYEAEQYNEAIGAKNVGFTYLPLGDDVKSYSEIYKRTVGAGWIIPSVVKNPEAIANILYDLIYPYKWKTDAKSNKVTTFGDATSNNTANEMKALVGRTKASSVGTLYTFISQTVSWGNYGIEDKLSPQAYVDSIKSQAQAELDLTWNGYTP